RQAIQLLLVQARQWEVRRGRARQLWCAAMRHQRLELLRIVVGQPQQQEALDTLATAERQRGFELDAVPLLRLTLVRIDEQRYHLIYTNHHILMDGWSNCELLQPSIRM
ncbi:condensation domain-containing protein, partial [Pseudomonas protegens]|uniref:condensation domain-containing protein n=1 Tax=Pseudomonas protegens TaxID=380021 RepID=UPI001B321935